MGGWHRPRAGKFKRPVRFYSQFASAKPGDPTVTKTEAKSEIGVVMPEAMVLVLDPMAGVKGVELGTYTDEGDWEPYPMSVSANAPKPVLPKRDPYQEAAITELQTQIGLAAAKK
jgi:hypothetical protein